MYSLSDQQVDCILDDIRAKGITIEGLQENLLDHVCILIEQELEAGGSFEACYDRVIRAFYKDELREIEKEALLLVKYRHHWVLRRGSFFLLLSVLLIGPFAGYDLVWLAGHGQETGWQLPMEIWGSTLVFALFPILFLLVLFLTPERLDPLIPRKSVVLIGMKPFISIVAC
jgi:hypothetical protein